MIIRNVQLTLAVCFMAGLSPGLTAAGKSQALAYKFATGNQTKVGTAVERVWQLPLDALPTGGKIKIDQNSGRFYTKSELGVPGADPENKKDYAVWLGPVTTKTVDKDGESIMELRQKVQGLQAGEYRLPGQFVGVDAQGKPVQIFTSAGPALKVQSGLGKGDKGQLIANENAEFELNLAKLWWLLAGLVLVIILVFLYIYYRPQLKRMGGRLAENAIIEPATDPLNDLLAVFREIQARYPGAAGENVTTRDIKDARTGLFHFLTRTWGFDTEGLTEGRFFDELNYQEIKLDIRQTEVLQNTLAEWSAARFGGDDLSLVRFFTQMDKLVELATVLSHRAKAGKNV